MTGPEHYRETERLLGLAEAEIEQYAATRDEKAEEYHLTQSTWAQQRAQVHATLALVAATAQQRTEGPDGADSLCDFNPDWAKAVGVQ